MPQSFGLFKPDNLLLRKEVCEDCNAYFGNELELKGARASVEGIHRFTAAKLCGPESFLKMPKGRVRWELEDPNWKDLRPHFQQGEDGEVEVQFKPQVIVTYDDGTKKTFLPEDITDIGQFEKAKGYRVCMVSNQDAQVVKEALGRGECPKFCVSDVGGGASGKELPDGSHDRPEVSRGAAEERFEA
jgi:hypothetical protein